MNDELNGGGASVNETAAADATVASTPALPEQPPSPEAVALEQKVVVALRSVFDPEIPVNIYDLGLIYTVEIHPEGKVAVKMTLTAPGCPVAGSLPGEVEAKIRACDGVSDAHVDLVWEPAWNPSMMSEAAKLQLGFNF